MAPRSGGRPTGPHTQIDHLRTWIDIWKAADPAFRSLLADTWILKHRSLQDLPPQQRWASVTGPTAATIALLLDLQWDPQVPTSWTGPGGDKVADIDTDDPFNTQSILQHITMQIIHKNWETASGHQAGQGLEQGPPIFARKKLRKGPI